MKSHKKVILFILFTIHVAKYALATSVEDASGYALNSLTVAKHLYSVYGNGICSQYADNKTILALASKVEASISEVFVLLSDDDRLLYYKLIKENYYIKMLLDTERSYIHDIIKNNSSGKGGLAYACGVSFGILRMMHNKATLEVSQVKELANIKK